MKFSEQPHNNLEDLCVKMSTAVPWKREKGIFLPTPGVHLRLTHVCQGHFHWECLTSEIWKRLSVISISENPSLAMNSSHKKLLVSTFKHETLIYRLFRLMDFEKFLQLWRNSNLYKFILDHLNVHSHLLDCPLDINKLSCFLISVL